MIPYDKRSGKIWYNNELVDWGDVKLHVLSHGIHYASCVFEGSTWEITKGKSGAVALTI